MFTADHNSDSNKHVVQQLYLSTKYTYVHIDYFIMLQNSNVSRHSDQVFLFFFLAIPGQYIVENSTHIRHVLFADVCTCDFRVIKIEREIAQNSAGSTKRRAIAAANSVSRKPNINYTSSTGVRVYGWVSPIH